MTVERFIQYLRFERRYSPHTVIAYQSDLDQFSEFILKTYETSNISGATPEMIRSWVVNLVESGLEARSINRKVTTLRSYYRFLTREKLVDSNPVATITPLKTAQKLPVFLENEKMSFMLDDVEFAEGYEGKRDKLAKQ